MQNTDTLIIAPGVPSLPQVGIGERARELTRALIWKAGAITQIQDEGQLGAAMVVSADMAGLVKLIEGERKTLKAPFSGIGKAIDAAADSVLIPLETGRKQLNRLAGEYEAGKRRLADEERARAARELMEARRKEAELAAAAAALEAQARPTAADLAKELEIEAAQEQVKLEQATAIAAVMFPTPKAEGATLRQDWEIIVTDVTALYEDCPHCVKLVPSLSMIKAQIKNTGKIPAGVTATPVNTLSGRA